MSKDKDRLSTLTRRSFVLGSIKGIAFLTLIGRLYYLQISESEKYKTLSEDNRINLKLVPSPRGTIFDRNGYALAKNTQSFRLDILPGQAKQADKILQSLSKIISLSEEEIQKIIKDIKRHKHAVSITIKENLSWEQVSKIELAAPTLPGIEVNAGEVRFYPLADKAVHIIGYVGSVSENDLADQDPILSTPGFKIGKVGIEKQYEDSLRGIAGTHEFEVNALGRTVRQLSKKEPKKGENIALTIDERLQRFSQERIRDEMSAAAVTMNVHTGEVLCLASHPSYDPNAFSLGITDTLWKELNSNPAAPLTNKVIAGQYAPGSTFKVLVALAALENKAINQNHSVYCSGHLTLGNHRFHCWKQGGHGTVDITTALAQSCDVFFYDLAMRMTIDKIAATAQLFGLGEKLNIELPGEKPGLMPTQSWKRSRFQEKWQQGETLINAIGQGYVLATPLQLATMTARLVNGGYAVKPLFVKNSPEAKPIQSLKIPVKDNNIQKILVGMNAVTNYPNGTAYGSRIIQPEWAMGGKTGTSQVRRITIAERIKGVITNENLPWKFRDHALFIGYAPVSQPKYACAVIVEHGGGGSKVAAPIARDILTECQKINLD